MFFKKEFSFNYTEWNIEVFGEMVDLTTITSTNLDEFLEKERQN